MTKLLIPAAAFAATCLLASAAQAGEVFKFEYLKAEKCVLKKVEVADPELCIMKLTQQIQDDCTSSGGTFKKAGLSCDIPSSKAKSFKIVIDKHFGQPGPYNPIPRQQALSVKEPKDKGCIKGATENPLGCAR